MNQSATTVEIAATIQPSLNRWNTMGKCLLLALLAFASTAMAEPKVIEETDDMTVYRDGDQIIVLADTDWPGTELPPFSFERAKQPTFIVRISDKVSRRAGTKFYLSNVRLIDGELLCEKVARRPATEFRSHVAAQIAAGRCRSSFL